MILSVLFFLHSFNYIPYSFPLWFAKQREERNERLSHSFSLFPKGTERKEVFKTQINLKQLFL